jgi:hypothetical protein
MSKRIGQAFQQRNFDGECSFVSGGEQGWGSGMIALLNFYVLTALLLGIGIWSAVSLLIH